MAKEVKDLKGPQVPYHKRLAMGEKLDGTSLGPKASSGGKPRGGLSGMKKK